MVWLNFPIDAEDAPSIFRLILAIDYNILSNKNDFKEKKELKFSFFTTMFFFCFLFFLLWGVTETTRKVQELPFWFIALDITIPLENDTKYTAKQNLSYYFFFSG